MKDQVKNDPRSASKQETVKNNQSTKKDAGKRDSNSPQNPSNKKTS